MARVTVTEVKEIIETTLEVSDIKPYITAANLTVTEWLGSSTVLSSAQLKEIERWLTAHFIAATRERQVSQEKIGESSAKYMGKSDDVGLNSTTYGQQAILLDTSGTLASGAGKKKASLYAVTSFALK